MVACEMGGQYYRNKAGCGRVAMLALIERAKEMRTGTRIRFLWLMVVCGLMVLGCSEKQDAGAPGGTPAGRLEVDETKPLSEVKAEAERMDAEQLKAAALKYKQAIEAKSAEVEKIAKELMQSMVADSSGEESKKLNARMSELNKSVEELAKRAQVYIDKLKEKGVDVSDLEVSKP